MNAPLNPALLAVPHDLALRVAEETRLAIAAAVLGDPHSLRIGGYHKAAESREHAHGEVMRFDVDKLVAELTGQPQAASSPAELAAFYEASRLAGLGTRRGPDGEPTQSAAQKGRAVWNAALRWARDSETP